MLKVSLAPHSQENYPGNLTEIFETDSLIGWIHWEGPAEIVVPEKLFSIIEELKSTPQIIPGFPPGTKFSLALISGANDSAKFQILGSAVVKIKRADKVITLSQNASGKLLETDTITFALEEDADLTSPVPVAFKLHDPREILLTHYKTLESSFSNRKTLYLALIILTIFISLVLYQLRSRTHEIRVSAINDVDSQVSSQIESAAALSELNFPLARSQLVQSQSEILAKVESSFGADWERENSAETKRLKEILGKLDDQLTRLSRIYKLADLPVFYDANIIRSDFRISASAQHETVMVLLDASLGSLLSLNTTTKAGKILSGDDLFKGGRAVDFLTSRTYVLSPEGIVIDKKLAIKRDAGWGEIQMMKVFAGNVYLLDPPKNTIWKYGALESGFGDITSYLGEGVTIDLSKTVDMTIDGDIYVLSSSGNVAKLSGGIPQDFGVRGLDTPLKDPSGIYTDEDLASVYIFDQGNSRVVVIDKKGNYQSQYILTPNLPSLTPQITADEANKRIFLFEGSKIYGLDIK